MKAEVLTKAYAAHPISGYPGKSRVVVVTQVCSCCCCCHHGTVKLHYRMKMQESLLHITQSSQVTPPTLAFAVFSDNAIYIDCLGVQPQPSTLFEYHSIVCFCFAFQGVASQHVTIPRGPRDTQTKGPRSVE